MKRKKEMEPYLLRRNRQRIRKAPLKSTISEGLWSEQCGSNARSPGPKGVRTWCYMCMNYIWPFPLRESYSPALFSPLSPRPPEAVVVSYVVVWKCSHGLRQIRRPPGAFGLQRSSARQSRPFWIFLRSLSASQQTKKYGITEHSLRFLKVLFLLLSQE